MSYATTANRPNPAGILGSIGVPSAFAVLLITGLAVTPVIVPPAPNPTATNFKIDPIEPIEEPVKPQETKAASTETQTPVQETTYTRPDSEFNFELGSSEPISGFPELSGDPSVGIGPVQIQGPPVAPVFDPTLAIPRGDPGEWITNNDYRPSWINRGYEGTASFALEIDARGRVNDCVITRSTGYSALDTATCSLLQRRARFDPAKDNSGNAVAGTYESSVNWRIP